MTITERLFKTMKEKGIKAADLAKKLKTSDSTVSNWKSRGTLPPANYSENTEYPAIVAKTRKNMF